MTDVPARTPITAWTPKKTPVISGDMITSTPSDYLAEGGLRGFDPAVKLTGWLTD
jgi:hypothetical protein